MDIQVFSSHMWLKTTKLGNTALVLHVPLHTSPPLIAAFQPFVFPPNIIHSFSVSLFFANTVI